MNLNRQDSQALVLLLSTQAAQDFGPRISAILQDRAYRLASPEEAAQANGACPVNIAFISRDVTGKSSKTRLEPPLLRFYDILRRSPGLAWVHAHSAGADRPIYPELRERGVRVTTSSGANADAVAQMALTGVLALGRCLPELMDAQRRKSWEPLLGPRAPRDLPGQTAVVVGLGPIGQEIARLLKALRMRVIGVRRGAVDTPPCDRTVAFSQVREALKEADWLILACPLTDETSGFLDAGAIAALPAGACVVNVARGEVAVERDLVAALQSGHLGGAFLDVFEQEPLDPASPLWDMRNVLVSPHTAGHSSGHYEAVGEIFLDNLARWRDGQPMKNMMA